MFVISLKDKDEFCLVSKHGKKLYSSNFLVIISKNPHALPYNYHNTVFFGIKVGKKISKKAVVRNKIKRRIRHLVKIVFHKNLITDSLAAIVIPKKGFDKVVFSQLTQEFSTVIARFCI